MRHAITYAFARGAGLLLRLLPRRARLGFGRALGSLVYAVDERHRARTLANVELAFGSEKSAAEKEAIAEGAFSAFKSRFFERYPVSWTSSEELPERDDHTSEREA